MNISNGRILLLLDSCQHIGRHIHEGNFVSEDDAALERDEVLKTEADFFVCLLIDSLFQGHKPELILKSFC